MTIEVLVCRPDGIQTVETRTVPDSWRDFPSNAETE